MRSKVGRKRTSLVVIRNQRLSVDCLVDLSLKLSSIVVETMGLMVKWRNGRLVGRTDGRTDGREDGRTGERTDGRPDGRTDV